MHAMVMKHFFNGGSYPFGGARSIARSIEPVIQASGGEIILQANVSELLMHKNRVNGVRLVNGDQIHAKNVISSVGVLKTYQNIPRLHYLRTTHVIKVVPRARTILVTAYQCLWLFAF